MRRYGSQTIERASQNDEHETRVGGGVGENEPRQRGGRASRQDPSHERAPIGHVHSHLR
jgi:hypothetical protein